jgi:hypothetical protein
MAVVPEKKGFNVRAAGGGRAESRYLKSCLLRVQMLQSIERQYITSGEITGWTRR